MKNFIPKLGLPLAILSVSTAAIFIRYAQLSASSITIACYRLIFAAMMMAPFYLKRAINEINENKFKNFGKMLFSGIFLAVHFGSWIYSLELTNVISSVVLVTTTPIWVTALSPAVFRERIHRSFYLGLFVSFIGVILISLSPIRIDFRDVLKSTQGNTQTMLGNALALLGALCAAGYVILGRLSRDSYSTMTYSFTVYFCAALILMVFILFTNPKQMIVTGEVLWWLLLLALIPQVIGHSLVNWSLGKLPASYVSIALLGEPIGATFFAYLFLDEIPNVIAVISGGIILVGIIFATKSNSTENGAI